MNHADGKLVAEAAMDAVAAVQEHVPGNPRLIGVHVMLVLGTPTGVRIVSSLKEKS